MVRKYHSQHSEENYKRTKNTKGNSCSAVMGCMLSSALCKQKYSEHYFRVGGIVLESGSSDTSFQGEVALPLPVQRASTVCNASSQSIEC